MLVLTREVVRPHLNAVTIAPLTTTIRGPSTEVLCGPANGLDDQETDLTRAGDAAFVLDSD